MTKNTTLWKPPPPFGEGQKNQYRASPTRKQDQHHQKRQRMSSKRIQTNSPSYCNFTRWREAHGSQPHNRQKRNRLTEFLLLQSKTRKRGQITSRYLNSKKILNFSLSCIKLINQVGKLVATIGEMSSFEDPQRLDHTYVPGAFGLWNSLPTCVFLEIFDLQISSYQSALMSKTEKVNQQFLCLGAIFFIYKQDCGAILFYL